MDERIKTQVPLYIRQPNERQKAEADACINGKPATDANIVKGIQNMVEKALKKPTRRRQSARFIKRFSM